ncbi:MAG TPA: hypothetical protein VM051_10915 [Usitatibacter sp.]|nr:hypothetical protein [Usitatibacter sp.]
MFKSIARFGAAIAATLAFALPASASTFSIDYSDLWGGGQPNPTENGWGLNLIQQGDVIFATMFVYGADNTPRWFSASSLTSGNGSTWTGSLAQTTGTYYGAPWAGNAVPTTVGTMTISFSNANTGQLSYSVNGVTVNKSISRFTLRAPNLAGKYLGGAVATCNNGNQVLIFDALNVTQSGTSVSMRVDFFNNAGTASVCTFNGTLATTGRTGSINGSYACTFGSTAGNAGNFSITNLESSINGFNATLTATDQFCPGGMTGRFGGVKDVL